MKGKIDSLQILRALAALLVVIWHSELAIKNFSNNYWVLGENVDRAANYPSVFNYLYIGVDIFFCISGFIMALLLDKQGGGIRQSIKFLSDRAIRILPPYWIFTLLVYLVYIASSGKFNVGKFSGDTYHDTLRLLTSALLLPQENFPALGVGWTLIHESIFYTFCGIMIVIGTNRHLLEALAIVSVVSVVISLSNISLAHGYVFSTFSVEFFFGALAYRLRDRSKNNPELKLIFSIIVYVLLTNILDSHLTHGNDLPIRQFGGGIIGFLLIHGLIGLDKKKEVSSTATGRLLVRIGGASYTLYLMHWFVLSAMGKVAIVFSGAPVYGVALWQTFSVLVSILAAVIFAEKIELPFHKVLANMNRTTASNTA